MCLQHHLLRIKRQLANFSLKKIYGQSLTSTMEKPDTYGYFGLMIPKRIQQ
jgi:hypothetical protein